MSSKKLAPMRIKLAVVYGLTAALAIALACGSFFRGFFIRTVLADNTAQMLSFTQDWSNTGLITADDNWSGVPGIVGHRGDDLTTTTGTDPQTIVADGSATPIDVNANRSDPNTFITGGLSEFDGIANPVVAVQGSGTADAPHIVIALNTTGNTNVTVAYNLRDIDGSTDNSTQAVALQYRVGPTGDYTNLPAGYVADASSGPSLATLVTPVSATLPPDCNERPLVQVRVITTNAVGSDEWIGIEDISVTGTTGGPPTLHIDDVSQAESDAGTTFAFNVSLSAPAPTGGVTFTVDTADGTTNPANEGSDYTGIVNGAGSITEGNTSTTIDVTVNGDFNSEANETFFVNISGISANAAGGDVQGLGTITNDDPLRIHDIQGAAHLSPVVNSAVSNIPGIVTALRSNGFYLQEPFDDGDDFTSEGIFVFTSSAPTVTVGDSLTVSGNVAEFRPGGAGSTSLTITEITTPSITLLSTGNPLPDTVIIGESDRVPPDEVIDDDATTGDVETSGDFDADNDGIDFYESLEGMLVEIESARVVGPTSDFGEIPVIGDDGTLEVAFAGVQTPRGGIVIRENDFNPERIIIDDAILAGSTPQVQVGDTFAEPVVGIMDYSFDNFKLLATSMLTAEPGELAPETTATNTSTQLSLATFNVENLDPSDGAEKFNTLASMIVDNLQSPDLVCLEEVQDNNGPTNDSDVDATTTYDTLISAITTAGGPTYQFRQINPVDDQDGGEPGGNIRVGFLFRTDRGLSFIDRPGGGPTTATTVIDVGGAPELSNSPGRIEPTDPAFNNSRKPLVGEFTLNGHPFFVIANHFVAKGADQPLFGRFQPPTLGSEAQRDAQAEIVNDFVDSIVAINPNANVVVMGDINDFQFSSPMETLKGGELHALIDELPEEERYSYVFEGNSQALDHILVSDNIFTNILFEYDVVHVNSEFLNNASDHDPSLVRLTLAPTAADGVVSGRLATAEGTPVSGAVVRLSGTQNRKTITDANGNYSFANVETSGFYTVAPSRANYSFSPSQRSFSQLGSNTEAGFTGSSAGESANPLDTAEYFVRQQYVDLLGREPDEGGFNYWSDRILECGSNALCENSRRRDVAAAFFIEQEFQRTGSFIYGLYKGALGRRPVYTEFSSDRQQVREGPNLEATKQAFAEGFVSRVEFASKYQANSSAESFVDALLLTVSQSSGIDLSNQRPNLVGRYNAGANLIQSRSFVLRDVIDNLGFRTAEYNRAFVLAEYFGYLQRDPDDGGYDFWLDVVSNRDVNNYRSMVCAFISSPEYQRRFSSIVSHNDSECGQ